MSEIEVLRVPDEQWSVEITEYKGSANVLYNGNVVNRIHHNAKPALLAALLEDAGYGEAWGVHDKQVDEWWISDEKDNRAVRIFLPKPKESSCP